MLGCAIESLVKSIQLLVDKYLGDLTPQIHTRLPQIPGSAIPNALCLVKTALHISRQNFPKVPITGSPEMPYPDTLCLVKTARRTPREAFPRFWFGSSKYTLFGP